MHLNTAQYILKYDRKLNAKNRMIISNLSSLERNTNLGSRKIIPDAIMQESNLSFYLETNFKSKVILENGIGVGEKYIKTLLTPSVNTAEKDIGPFTKFAPYYNAFTGVSFIPNKRFNMKFNASTGVRIPNLAELSSNGLHEGVFTYEIGDPKMKNEQNVMLNLNSTYAYHIIDIWGGLFFNQFLNYVYLAPTTELWRGFPVYRYKQQDAQQYGGELNIGVKATRNLTISTSYSGMTSMTADGNYTPFIPAQRITPKVNYSATLRGNMSLQLFTEICDVYSANPSCIK